MLSAAQRKERLDEAMAELIDHAFDFPVDLSRLWTLGDPQNPELDPPEDERVSEKFLPYLAWALGVELWPRNELVSFDEKRKLVQNYIRIRKLRGTIAALELSYAAIGVRADIIERPAGEPFTVRISFSSEVKNITDELRSAIIRLTDQLKPLWVHYVLDVRFELAGSVKAFGVGSIRPIIKGSAGRSWPF